MISTLKNNLTFLAAVCVAVGFLFPFTSSAQEALSLAISPTLIELGSAPGEAWQSTVRIINSNDYDLTVYGSVVNFEPVGESGQGRFISIAESSASGATLAEWITLPEGEITIAAQSTGEIPFRVLVPDEAEPGGHFAALLVGTQPPASEGSVVGLRTSQMVTSLFFLNVDGDIIEDGLIRSFTTSDSFGQIPDVSFTLRFENRGNVHLQPQGEVIIYNMWGKERGRIPINYHTSFGNALPGMIRKFEFNWTGDFSFSDIGLYRATAAVTYGSSVKKFSDQTAYFWVIPFKGLLITFLVIGLLVGFMVWAVRTYVRRMLALAGVQHPAATVTSYVPSPVQPNVVPADHHELNMRDIMAPVREGVVDLKVTTSSAHSWTERLVHWYAFVLQYKHFFLALVAIFALFIGLTWYFADIFNDATDYSIQIGDTANPVNMNAEEVAFNRHHSGGLVDPLLDQREYDVQYINVSGTAGLAGRVAATLVEAGFPISELLVDISRKQERSIIVFPPELQEQALLMSDAMGQVILSAEERSDLSITVYVGADQKSE